MPTIDEALSIALQYQNLGMLTEAEGIYQQVLKLQPDNVQARRRLDALEGQRPLQGISKLMGSMQHALRYQNFLQAQQLIASILANPRYADPRRLERFGAKYYSQNDEDGILQEIFRRIGTTNKTFVEFGVENGLENNTLLLLHQEWKGVWLEGSEAHVAAIQKKFASILETGQLRVFNRFIKRENVNDIFAELALPEDLDLLSIDIDGNDYYIFEALTVVRPRVVSIEYNSKFPPPTRAVIKYDENFRWPGTDYFGTSLQSLTDLADRKGYRLVGCSIAGTNAFYVRSDLVGDHFQAPYTAENFYQPPRYYLSFYGYIGDHRADFGPYERI